MQPLAFPNSYRLASRSMTPTPKAGFNPHHAVRNPSTVQPCFGIAETSPRLYLEDLQALVGRDHLFRSSQSAPLSQEKIIAFAREYDPQPFHTDPEAAKESFFGRLVASGCQTLSITMGLVVQSLPIAEGLVGGGYEKMQLIRPVYPGDSLHTETKVQSVLPSTTKPVGKVVLKVFTYNQNHEPVVSLNFSLRVPKKPVS